MTMRYARFHPDYGHVEPNLDRVAAGFGVSTAAAGSRSGSSADVEANR